MTDTLGPVSRVLEVDIRDWLARHNLVIWPDPDDHYSDFVQQLIQLRAAEELKYDVYAFRGSYLELMLEIEDVAGGVDKTRALIHLPAFSHESIKSTPLFELYRAGKRYQKALSTLVADAAAGNVRPEQIDDFLGRNNLSLSAADVWLHDLLTEGSEGLASQLRNVSLTELIDDLLFKRFLAQRVAPMDGKPNERDEQALWDRIAALTGMPDEWRESSLTTSTPSAEEIAYTVSSWALCVSYVCDLSGKPQSDVLQSIPGLPQKVKDGCCQLAAHLQETHPSFYRQTADETESRLVGEVDNAQASELGRVDTFRFEEELVFKAALQMTRPGLPNRNNRRGS